MLYSRLEREAESWKLDPQYVCCMLTHVVLHHYEKERRCERNDGISRQTSQKSGIKILSACTCK